MTQPLTPETMGALLPVPNWRRRWLAPLAAIALLLLAIGLAFAPAVEAAVRVWIVSPTFTHCFLIVPMSAYLIWQKRAELATMEPETFPWALAAMPPAALLFLLGRFAGIMEVQQIAIMTMVQAVLMAVLGWRVYRVLWFPFLFLYMLVPTGEYLVPKLQSFTTSFVHLGLDLLGVPVFVDGTLLQLSSGNYQVAEACAGLRFLIATIAVGALFAYLSYGKWWKWLLFLAACLVVPVIANGFRALGIVMLAYSTDNELAAGADHLVYGWGFSVVVLMLLLGFGQRFRDPLPPLETHPPARAGGAGGKALALVAAIALPLALAAPALASWHDGRALIAHLAARRLPERLGALAVQPSTLAWAPDTTGADDKAGYRLTTDGATAPVDLWIDLFARPRRGHELVTSGNRLVDEEDGRTADDRRVSANVGGRPVEIAETRVIPHGHVQRLAWRWYWIGGGYTGSGLTAKLRQLSTALLGGDESAALLTLSTPIDGTDIAAARQRLEAAAAALEPLPATLAAAGAP